MREDRSCDFCGEEDDAVHTLRDCPAWNVKRLQLTRKLNLDFTLGDVVKIIITSWKFWRAFSKFAEKVMRKKEKEKRRRERMVNLPLPSSGDDESEWRQGLLDSWYLYYNVLHLFFHSLSLFIYFIFTHSVFCPRCPSVFITRHTVCLLSVIKKKGDQG